jgi:hypothetical protein
MGANTPGGYPYPLPTEPVRDGALRIRELAEATDRLSNTIMEASNTGTYSVPTGVWRFMTTVAPPNNERDPLAYITHDGSSILLQKAGWWRVWIVVKWLGGTAGTTHSRRWIGWSTSNSTPPGQWAQSGISTTGSTQVCQTFADISNVNAVPARVAAYAFQDSEGAINVNWVRTVAQWVSPPTAP